MYGCIRLRQGPIGSDDQRLPTVAPASTPGIVIGWGSDGTRGKRRELEFGRSALAERIAQRAAQHLVHQRLLEKPDLRFRRMHVDVDPVGRNPDEQVDFGAPLLDRRDAVGLGNRVRDGAVLHDAAVDEDVLGAAHRPLIAECRNVAVDLQPRRLLAHFDQIEAFAEELEKSFRRPVRRRALEQPARPAPPDVDAPLVSVNPTSG